MAGIDPATKAAEELAVRQVRQSWAFARDHGEWDTMKSCFHPEATLIVSWYSGPVAGFIERSMQMTAARNPEERSKHWLGNARTTIWDKRAVLETDFMILTRDLIDGHLFDYSSWGRFLDQIEKRDGVWRILRWTTIYDKDRLDPVIPGAVPAAFYARVRVEGHGSGFAFMQLRQDKRGRAAPPGLVFGHTEAERKLHEDARSWLAAG